MREMICDLTEQFALAYLRANPPKTPYSDVGHGASGKSWIRLLHANTAPATIRPRKVAHVAPPIHSRAACGLRLDIRRGLG